MIQEIEIEKLRLHPKNVRRDYGDLTDLENSIRAQGILMNLTVVHDPVDASYYLVVDGNCRLIAARAAGIATAPCAVVEMTEREQLRTMLLANMQRKNLSTLEEARGVQMCLDLGDTEKELASYTGLSKKTIQNRRAIAQINTEGVEDKILKNVTIEELLKIAQLKDETNRIMAFKATGTNNFSYTIQELKTNEEWKERKAKIAEILKEKLDAAEQSEPVRYNKYEKLWAINNPEDAERICTRNADGAPDKSYGWRESYRAIVLYQLKGETEEVVEVEEDNREGVDLEEDDLELMSLFQKREELQEKTKRLRKEFAAEKLVHYFDRTTEEKLNKLIGWMVFNLAGGIFNNVYAEDVLEILEVKPDEGCEEYYEAGKIAQEASQGQPGKTARLIYTTLENESVFPIHANGDYWKNEAYEHLYRFLEDFGYEISDEEQKVLDGTHELIKVVR